MKQVVLVAMLLLAVSAEAQQYRKFLFALDVGYPLNNLSPIGSYTMEPGYRLSDKILIGFRMEQTGFVSQISTYSSLGSLGLNSHYYFGFTSMRLFAGAGIGLYNPSNNFIMSNTETQNQRNGLGMYPRMGLEFGHARVMIEYNFIQKMKYYTAPYLNPTPTVVNLSYLSLKIGFYIGGGKKK